MLTFEDCVELSELPEDVIQAIAVHDHIPMIIALEMGVKMKNTPAGQRRICQCIRDDIDHYREIGDRRHSRYYEDVLRRFESTLPGLQ